MTCDLCNDTGYVMQDIGTATVPDYVEIACACSPEPTDEDAPNWLDDPDFIIEGESVLYVPKGWPDDFGHPGDPDDPNLIEAIKDADPDYPGDYDDSWVPGTGWEDFHRTPPFRPDPSEYALPAHLLA